MTRINNTRGPAPEQAPKGPRISRRKRKRQNKDTEYLAIRDVYLEENPTCVLCGKPVTQVHHILRGANRERGLLNSNTWLECCSIECHDKVERMSWEKQVALKQKVVEETVIRLRK